MTGKKERMDQREGISDAAGLQAPVVPVRRYADLALRNQLPKPLLIDSLILSDFPELRCDDALSCGIHLRSVPHAILLIRGVRGLTRAYSHTRNQCLRRINININPYAGIIRTGSMGLECGALNLSFYAPRIKGFYNASMTHARIRNGE